QWSRRSLVRAHCLIRNRRSARTVRNNRTLTLLIRLPIQSWSFRSLTTSSRPQGKRLLNEAVTDRKKVIQEIGRMAQKRGTDGMRAWTLIPHFQVHHQVQIRNQMQRVWMERSARNKEVVPRSWLRGLPEGLQTVILSMTRILYCPR